MKYVKTIHGPVALWRWNLARWFWRNVERVQALGCLVLPHLVVPDVTRLYCVRCKRFVK